VVDELHVVPETAAAIAALGQGSLERQLATGDSLDGKAWAAVAAGSIVVSLGAVGNTNSILLTLAAVAYLGVAWSAIRTVRPRR
jgi:hypothetical protein